MSYRPILLRVARRIEDCLEGNVFAMVDSQVIEIELIYMFDNIIYFLKIFR